MGPILTKEDTCKDPRIGACVYVLHGLLQRLEEQRPGIIDEMVEGAIHDRAGIDPDASADAAHGREIVDEAIRMLRLLSKQLRS